MAALLAVLMGGCAGGAGEKWSYTGASGDQAWSYHGARALVVCFQTRNNALYRRLLPAAFQMPYMPLLVVSVASYFNVSPPLVPYREGFAMLACRLHGQPGLYTLTMPVTNKTAQIAGTALGFPKYIADSIDLTTHNGRWSGRVVYHARNLIRISFTPYAGKSESTVTHLQMPLVNLVPPGVGPQVMTVDAAGQMRLTTTDGTATVTVDPSQPWAKLLDGATPVLEQLRKTTGNWSLVAGMRWVSGK